MFHVDHFSSEITQKGRSKLIEDPGSIKTEVEGALLVLSSVDKEDEQDPGTVSGKTAEEIKKLAERLKVYTVILHPFAHLFGELSSPEIAVDVLKGTEETLKKEGFQVVRTPFGWFNTLNLRAKGHPLSRVARIVTAEGNEEK